VGTTTRLFQAALIKRKGPYHRVVGKATSGGNTGLSERNRQRATRVVPNAVVQTERVNFLNRRVQDSGPRPVYDRGGGVEAKKYGKREQN